MKKDIISGFSVFLLALPLCLGIAIASGTPPIAGIFTAIIGGILASCVGSSSLTIKGPAAGMIVIVLGAVQELGQGDMLLGYRLMLAVGVIAACIQIVIALMRKAVIAEIMPPSVIHGMLAAIGVIIIVKQAYVLCGVAPAFSKTHELLFYFPAQVFSVNPTVFGIGVFAFLIVIFWPKVKKLNFIPSSLVVLCAAIPLSIFFDLPQKLCIQLPLNFFDGIQTPDFSQILSPVSIKYIVMFALVGSIESLLTVCAVDSITGKTSNLNKDLQATGIANLASACVGGLPMISEIVRSKANIDYGATSVRSNFFHGLFMLMAVLFLPSVMNMIPLSALAALLIFVGLRLASPKEFKHAYHVGKDQFIIFFTTFVVTLLTDLLVGVAAGLAAEVFILLARGERLTSLFYPTFAVEKNVLLVDGPLTFLGYLKFKGQILKLAQEYNHIIISFHAVTYIDHTVMKKLDMLRHEHPAIQITIQDNQQLAPLYGHVLSARSRTK
ncbi:MAG: SulP family inorganic anion transporter [Verrucomicrobia bacterium]|nr:SulP family inorganic anion transporter [Verrucomicrobiota bacterium]